MAGYSPTPLVGKLGLKPGASAGVMNPPGSYDDLLGVSNAATVLSAALPVPKGLTYLHLFTRARTELEAVLAAARHRIAPHAMIWVSWPKKASRQPTDVTEDVIRAVALPMGYVDIKVCAVDEIWSGLKLVVRKDLR